MFIWKLVPINPDSRVWEASTLIGELFVRAATEHEARQIASEKLRIASRSILGQDVAANPWPNPNEVTCKETDDSGYLLEGPSEILGCKSYR